jgi:hypothetical protein
MTFTSLTGYVFSDEVERHLHLPWRDVLALPLSGVDRPFAKKISTSALHRFAGELTESNRSAFDSSRLAFEMADAERPDALYGSEKVRHSSRFNPDEVMDVFSGRSGLRYKWRHISYEEDHLLKAVAVNDLTGNPLTLFDIAFMMMTNSYSYDVPEFLTVGDLANVFHLEDDVTEQFHGSSLKARSSKVMRQAYTKFGDSVLSGEFLAWTMVGEWGSYSDEYVDNYLRHDHTVALSKRMTASQALDALGSGVQNAQNLFSLTRHANFEFVKHLVSHEVTKPQFVNRTYRSGMDANNAVRWFKAGLQGKELFRHLNIASAYGLDFGTYIKWYEAGFRDMDSVMRFISSDINVELASGILGSALRSDEEK